MGFEGTSLRPYVEIRVYLLQFRFSGVLLSYDCKRPGTRDDITQHIAVLLRSAMITLPMSMICYLCRELATDFGASCKFGCIYSAFLGLPLVPDAAGDNVALQPRLRSDCSRLTSDGFFVGEHGFNVLLHSLWLWQPSFLDGSCFTCLLACCVLCSSGWINRLSFRPVACLPRDSDACMHLFSPLYPGPCLPPCHLRACFACPAEPARGHDAAGGVAGHDGAGQRLGRGGRGRLRR